MYQKRDEDTDYEIDKRIVWSCYCLYFSEPGAMGAGGCFEWLRLSGEPFFFSYIDEESKWELVKEDFEGINGCFYWSYFWIPFYPFNDSAV